MQTKPDKPTPNLFRINMKGDITGCNDINCITLQVTSDNITNVNLSGIKVTGNAFINLDTADVPLSAVDTIYALRFQKRPVLPTNEYFRINMLGDIKGVNVVEANDVFTKNVNVDELRINK